MWRYIGRRISVPYDVATSRKRARQLYLKGMARVIVKVDAHGLCDGRPIRRKQNAGERLRLAYEYKHAHAILVLIQQPPACGRIDRHRVLRLPMEEFFADRAILVARQR